MTCGMLVLEVTIYSITLYNDNIRILHFVLANSLLFALCKIGLTKIQDYITNENFFFIYIYIFEFF